MCELDHKEHCAEELMLLNCGVGKDLDDRKIEGKRRKEGQRIRWLDSVTDSTDMNLSTLLVLVENRGAWNAIVYVTESDTTQQLNKNNKSRGKCGYFNK